MNVPIELVLTTITRLILSYQRAVQRGQKTVNLNTLGTESAELLKKLNILNEELGPGKVTDEDSETATD